MNEIELKYQGLLERVSQQAARYENEIAELRVSLTLVSQERDQLRERVAEHEQGKQGQKASTEEGTDVVVPTLDQITDPES